MKFANDKNVFDYFKFSENQVAQFLEKPTKISDLAQEVDVFLRDCLEDGHQLHPIVSFLFINSYFLLLASFKTAATGHVAAVYPQIRAALESGCYGYLMSRKPELIDIWIYRERSEPDKKIAKRLLGSAVAEARRLLKEEDHDSLSVLVEQGYESSITFGAHPNSRSVIGHLESEPDDGSDFWRFNLTCMYAIDSFETQRALFSCIEYVLIIAGIAVVSHQPHPRQVELIARFMQLHEKKESLIEDLGWESHE